MKKYFFLILILVSTSASMNVFAQDIITTKSGEEIKAKLLKLTRKTATYKTYDDPEFSTYTLPYKELASIKKEGQKKAILFNHHLPRGYISFGILGPGSSVPLGSMAKADFNSSTVEPGFAKSGFNLKFEVAFYIIKRLGLTIMFGYRDNPFQYDKYASAFNNENSNNNGINNGSFGANSQSGNNDFKGYYFDNGNISNEDLNNWNFKNLLIGPIYSIKLGRRLTWDFKARAGVVETNKPNVVLTYTPAIGNTIYYDYTRSKKTEFGYNYGTAIRFSLSKRFAIFGSVDYIHTSPTINFTERTATYTNNTSNNNGPVTNSVNVSAKYNLSTLNTVIGFAYQFKRKRNKYE